MSDLQSGFERELAKALAEADPTMSATDGQPAPYEWAVTNIERDKEGFLVGASIVPVRRVVLP